MKTFLLFFLLFMVSLSFSQDYILDGTPGIQNISTCGGVFYDTGGAGGPLDEVNFYPGGELDTITFCPDVDGKKVRAIVESFYLEIGDFLFVYDGFEVTSTNLIGYYSQDFNGQDLLIGDTIQASSLNEGGCLTFVFSSDLDYKQNIGWAFNLSCFISCQEIIGMGIFNGYNADDSIIKICRGTSVDFAGFGIYPDMGTPIQLYEQNNQLSEFKWKINKNQNWTNTILGVFNPSTGYSEASYIFADTGIYHAVMIIRDTLSGLECINKNYVHNIVYVTGEQNFANSSLQSSSICLGDTNSMITNLQNYVLNDDCSSPYAVNRLIPDAQDLYGMSYLESKVEFYCYGNRQLTNVSELESVCMEIEHSSMGDLDVSLSCPSGNTVRLLVQDLTSNANLGINNFLIGTAMGTVDTYCFNETASSNTLNNVATDLSTATYIPGGFYLPFESFSNLIGCPLNGVWTLKVKDSKMGDNGYARLSGISFSSAVELFSDTVLQVTPIQYMWSNDPLNGSNTILSGVLNTDTLVVQPAETGNFSYRIAVTDNYGCTVDTNFTFEVLDKNQADFIYNGNLIFCQGDNTTLQPQFVEGAVGILGQAGLFSSAPNGLMIDATTGVIDIQNSNPGVYSVVNFVSTSGSNCTDEHTFSFPIIIYPKPKPIIIPVGTDCNLDTLIIQAGLNDSPYVSYLWSNGFTNDTLILTQNVDQLTIAIIDTNSCSGTSLPIDVNLTDIQMPSSLNSTVQVYCEGQYKIVNDLGVTGNGGNLLYMYKNGNNFETKSLSDTLISGEYYVYQSYPNVSCPNSDSLIIQVTINEVANPTSPLSVHNLCDYDQLVSDLDINSGGETLTYYYIYDQNPQVINPSNELLSGTYFVTGSDPVTLCQSTDSLQIEVNISELPDPAIYSLYDTIPVGMNHSINAYNVSQGQTLRWWLETTNSPVIGTSDMLNISISTSSNFLFQALDQSTGCLSKIDTIRIGVANLKYFSVYRDLNSNCSIDPAEPKIPFYLIYIQPGEIIGTTDFNGNFIAPNLNNGTYTAYIDSTLAGWDNCVDNVSFTIDGSANEPTFLGMNTNFNCADPSLDIYAPSLIRCFSNRMIYISARNDDYTETIIPDAIIKVELDDLIQLDSANYPYTDIGNNTFLFEVGNINEWDVKQIRLSTTISCDATLGQTLCVAASFYNVGVCILDTSANTNTIPCSTVYDQSDLIAQGWCANDTVFFRVKNEALNGDMTCYTPVRLFLDGLFYYYDSVLLASQEERIFSFAGSGQTYIVQVDQHPLHPGNSNPTAYVEACGAGSSWMPDQVNNLPLDNLDPASDVFCGLVSGSYDPNDKKGYPVGINSSNDIMPNQDIQYVIRFQNTGTDTAHRVVIRDTLDLDMDIFSIVSGASSHNYVFSIRDSRVLEWVFNSIMLPDSMTNEELSKGFVSFKVKQNRDLPNGTKIKNKAEIYFDFNEPIITNQTLHTINSCIENSTITTIGVTSSGPYLWELTNQTITQSGTYDHFLQNIMGCDSIIRLNATILNDVNVLENQVGQQILVYPNPTNQKLYVEFKGTETKDLQIELVDLTGKQILTMRGLNLKNEILLSELMSRGAYFLMVKDASDVLLLKGKIVLQ